MRRQQAASLFWMAFSILVIYGASQLGIGDPSAPGVGFLSFGAACLLLIFSTTRLIQASLAGERQGTATEALFRGKLWWRVVLVMAGLFSYTYVLPLLGYVIATFLLMLLLLWVAGGRKIWVVSAYAACMTVVTYYVFSKCLQCQFPMGPFGF